MWGREGRAHPLPYPSISQRAHVTATLKVHLHSNPLFAAAAAGRFWPNPAKPPTAAHRNGVPSTSPTDCAHHVRQLSLPVVFSYEYAGGHYYQSILTFDHRAADDAQLQHVVRLDSKFCLEASCDGLFILSTCYRQYSVHNPATRQYARLREIDGFKVLGMYEHGPTGQHRLLLYWFQVSMRYDNPTFEGLDGSYIFTLGSGQPPRHIGCSEAEEVMSQRAALLFDCCLHWHLAEVKSGSNMIMVFDTTAESFRQMPCPVDEGVGLFEMDGMLSMYRFCDEETNIDIWLLRDYERKVWVFKCRVELPVAEFSAQFEEFDVYYRTVVVATSCDGDVLVLVRVADCLLYVDMDGKLVASFHCDGLHPTQLRLKQTLVPHSFFPTL